MVIERNSQTATWLAAPLDTLSSFQVHRHLCNSVKCQKQKRREALGGGNVQVFLGDVKLGSYLDDILLGGGQPLIQLLLLERKLRSDSRDRASLTWGNPSDAGNG